MKKLVELSADDLETLRLMSKRFPKRNRHAETPEELLTVRFGSKENLERMAEREVGSPFQGFVLVGLIVAGIFALIGLVDFVWRLLTR